MFFCCDQMIYNSHEHFLFDECSVCNSFILLIHFIDELDDFIGSRHSAYRFNHTINN